MTNLDEPVLGKDGPDRAEEAKGAAGLMERIKELNQRIAAR